MDDGEPEIMEGSKVDDSETQEVSNESDVLTEEPLENEDDQLKKIAEEETTIEEGKAESADMKSKVFNAVKASAATAAKVTGDVIHKVESAVHRDSSQEDLKNMQDKSVNSDDSMEDEKAGGHEANPDAPVERRPSAASKILLAASAASKTVVTSAKTAAKVTGDVISKATESVRRPADKKADDSVLAVGDEMDGYCEQCEGKILPCKVLECVQEEGEPDLYIVEFNLLDLELGDSNGIQATLLRKQIFSRPIEAVEKEAEKTCEGEGATEELPPKDTQKLWSSVRTFTGAVGGFSSRAWANTTEAVSKVAKKAPAESSETAPAGSSSEPAIESVASTDEGAEEGSFEGAAAEGQEGVEKGEEKGEAETTAEQDASRDRSESVSNKLFSSVRRMSEALSESASAAYKAAEPVAVSTAAKVSQGAQSAWMSTVEKVKAVTAKKPVDGEGSVEGEGAEVNSTGADVGGSVATDISSVDGDGTASTTDIDNGETAESGETAAAAASAAVEEEEEGEGVQTEEEAATEDVKVEEEETAGADDVQGAEEVPETTQQEQQEQEGEEQDGANEKSVDDEGEGDAEVTETADGDDVDGDVDATADEGEEAEGGEARSGAGKKKKKKKGKK